MDLGLRLLYEAKVITVPGSGFGPTGEGHIRLSFGAAEEELGAFDRMEVGASVIVRDTFSHGAHRDIGPSQTMSVLEPPEAGIAYTACSLSCFWFQKAGQDCPFRYSDFSGNPHSC